LNPNVDMLGEVFIGIAGYVQDSTTREIKIIYYTKSINACINNIPHFEETCRKWYQTIKDNHTKFNPRDKTATVSKEIRNYTTAKALELCLEFVTKNNLIVPDFIIERRKKNAKSDRGTHTSIPDNKFNKLLKEVCVSDCHDVVTSDRINTAEYSKLKKSIKQRPTTISLRRHKSLPLPIMTNPQNIKPQSFGGNKNRTRRKMKHTYE